MFNKKKIEQLDFVISKLDSRIAFLERKEANKAYVLNEKYVNLLKHLGLEEVTLKGTPEEVKLMTKDEIKKNKDKIKPENDGFSRSEILKQAAGAMAAACSSNYYLNPFKFWR
jgi:hypothetical protein